MRQQLRPIVTSLLLLCLIILPAAAPAAAEPSQPAPAHLAGNPGSWYLGATPPNPDPTKPILVFVHGMGGSASAWWGETAYHGTNDMYAYAYNNGYRTAFVDLEPEGDMWANGELLHQQLTQITDYFDVERVVVVAHSKGGVDVNAATAFYGAGPMVERVITLGSPHWGTPLADLAYSTWAWWLAALLGQHSDGTFVLQTGYMAWFRSEADAAPDQAPFYTIGGRKCGPFLTALWWGCVYLAGEDDGVVPLDYSHKPGATILADGSWDHDEIRMGSRVWGAISGALQGSGAGASAAGSSGGLGNILVRGGEVSGTAAGTSFPLESGVRKATLVFYASSPDFAAALTGPDGSTYTVKMEAQVPAGDVFAGAWVGSVELAKPAAGEWRFSTSAPERAGYLMVATLDTDFSARLKLDRLVAEPGSTQELAVSLTGKPAGVRVSVNGATFTGRQTTITLPQREGVQNLTVTVTGTLADGTAFERTLVGSVAVWTPGEPAPWRRR